MHVVVVVSCYLGAERCVVLMLNLADTSTDISQEGRFKPQITDRFPRSLPQRFVFCG